MYCLKCGYKIPAGALFCPNCGAKVQAASPAQPSAVPSGTAQSETDAQPDAGSSEQNEQSTAQTRQEPEGQHEAVPHIGQSAPPVAPQSAQNNAQPAGDPLAAIVGKHADYYLAEFKKIDAGQKTRFNWAAFLLGPIMCFYRRSGELFKKYLLPFYVALLVTVLVAMVSILLSLSAATMAVGVVLMMVSGVFGIGVVIFGLVNTIRFGRNFNREYYTHCKQQLTRPVPERKVGTSIKNIVLFLLALTGVWIVMSIVSGLLSMFMLSAALNSIWGDDSYYNEDTYVESSSYYDEADSYTERPASSERQTASSTSEAITEYNLPVGTYQLWIGYGGTTASIRLWNEPSDPETPWYCDVILWNGIDAIVDEYYGSAYVSDDLQTIICGDYTFGIGYDGSVLVDDSLSDVPYDVIYYSGDTSMETGLNALIDISDEFTPVTKEAVDAYSDLYSLDRTIIHMSMY